MNQVHAFAERVLPVPVARARAAVADYRGVRARIAAPRLRGYEVLSGGVGAGTVLRWTQGFGRARDCLVEVSAPRPGTLVEADRRSTQVLTWTVDGSDELASVRVVVTWEGGHGLRGLVERVVAPVPAREALEALLAGVAAELAR